MFLEYLEGINTYKIYCLKIGFKKYIITRNVILNETEMPYKSKISSNELEIIIMVRRQIIRWRLTKHDFLKDNEVNNHVEKG